MFLLMLANNAACLTMVYTITLVMDLPLLFKNKISSNPLAAGLCLCRNSYALISFMVLSAMGTQRSLSPFPFTRMTPFSKKEVRTFELG
jgi:uncharacterized membrane protein